MRRLFRNKLFVICFVIITLLLVAAFTAGENSKLSVVRNFLTVPLKPLQQGVNSVTGGIKEFFGFLGDAKTAREENKELRERVLELEKTLEEVEHIKRQNEELRALYSFKEEFSEEFIGCNIISKEAGNWFDVFTIDRGSSDGIAVNDTVVNANGLVGRVFKVDLLSSKVVAIIDTDSSVYARLTNTRDLVFLRGDSNLRLQGLCRLDYIPPGVEVSVGDKIETAGMSSLYPKGITIGHVVGVVKNEGQFDSYAIIKPSVDFRRLENVVVLKLNREGE